MNSDTIDYQRMVQDALLKVVRQSLHVAADHGMPGAHHFYIAFATGVPGVAIGESLRRQYPDQMTIVLQHDFKNLEVLDEHFAVTLRFGGVPQRLIVPFHAVVSFYDPSVQFALRFDLASAPAAAEEVETAEEAPVRDDEERPRRPPVRAVLAAADRLAAAKAKVEEAEAAEQADAEAEAEDAASTAPTVAIELPDDPSEDDEPRGAEIVSFDAFRRR